MAASPGRSVEARRPLRVHPLRLLLDRVPELLVERRSLSRSGGPAASLSLAHRFPRRSAGRAARWPRGPVPPLSLPHHHELRPNLPKEPEPGQGDCSYQRDDGSAAIVKSAASTRLAPAGNRSQIALISWFEFKSELFDGLQR